MSRRNQILELALSYAARQPTPEQADEDLDQLLSQGMRESDVTDAIAFVKQESTPTIAIHHVTQLTANILLAATPPQTDRALHLLADVGVQLHRRFDKQSLRLAVLFLQNVRQLADGEPFITAEAFVRDAVARVKLAELGYDARVNVRTAVSHCQASRAFLGDDSPLYAESFMVEGTALAAIAMLGLATKQNLLKAIRCGRQATEMFDRLIPLSHSAGVARMHESTNRALAAELGIAPVRNYCRSIKLMKNLASHQGWTPAAIAAASNNVALQRMHLAELGVNAIENSKAAIALLRRTRGDLSEVDPQFPYYLARSLFNEATSRLLLFELVPSDFMGVKLAIQLCAKGKSLIDPDTPDYASGCMAEADGRMQLATLRISPAMNLKRALALCAEARRCFDVGSVHARRVDHTESTIRSMLSRLGASPKDQALAAIACAKRSRQSLDPQDRGVGISLLHEGQGLLSLARHDSAWRSDLLAQALLCFQEAQRSLEVTGLWYVNALTKESEVWYLLGKSGQSPQADLEQSFRVAKSAEALVRVGSREWCVVINRQALALEALSRDEEAILMLTRAVESADYARWSIIAETNRESYLETLYRIYSLLVDACCRCACQDGRYREKWALETWHRVHWLKARILRDALFARSTNHRTEQMPKEGVSAIDYELGIRAREARWLRGIIEDGTRGLRKTHVAAIRQRLAALEQDIHQLMPQTMDNETIPTFRVPAVLDHSLPSPDKVKEALNELGRGRTRGTEHETTGKSPAQRVVVLDFFLGRFGTTIFVVPTWLDSPPRIVKIKDTVKSAGMLSSAIRRHYMLAGRSPIDRNERDAHKWRKLSQEMAEHGEVLADSLSKSLMELGHLYLNPLTAHLEELQPDVLVLSPHGIFANIPLHAASYQASPLIERFDMIYLPSAALAEQLVGREELIANEPALLIGDPNQDLAAAQVELLHIKKWFDRAGVPTRSLSGQEATAMDVCRLARNASVVHIAAHSVFNSRKGSRARIDLADRPVDGVEIAETFYLHGTRLVYLNSCDSGQSVLDLTMGFQSLARSFLLAGASSVLGALHSVRDDVADAFADTFYRSWANDGDGVARAFRRATMATRELYTSPLDWAPYSLVGDWNSRLVTDH